MANEYILKNACATFAGIVDIPADVLAMVLPCDPVSQPDDIECFYDSDESSDHDYQCVVTVLCKYVMLPYDVRPILLYVCILASMQH